MLFDAQITLSFQLGMTHIWYDADQSSVTFAMKRIRAEAAAKKE